MVRLVDVSKEDFLEELRTLMNKCLAESCANTVLPIRSYSPRVLPSPLPSALKRPVIATAETTALAGIPQLQSPTRSVSPIVLASPSSNSRGNIINNNASSPAVNVNSNSHNNNASNIKSSSSFNDADYESAIVESSSRASLDNRSRPHPIFLSSDSSEAEVLQRRSSGLAVAHEWASRHMRGFTAHAEEKVQTLRRRAGRAQTPAAGQLAQARFAIKVEEAERKKAPAQFRREDSKSSTATETVPYASEDSYNMFKPRSTNRGENNAVYAWKEDAEHLKDLYTEIESSKKRQREDPSSDTEHDRSEKSSNGKQLVAEQDQDMAPQTSARPRKMSLQEAIQDDKMTCREKAEIFVQSPIFDTLTSIVVVANAISLGVQTDYMSKHLDLDSPPLVFRIIELFFCAVFSIEILFRLVAFRLEFFRQDGWGWNIFDMLMVAIQLLDELIQATMHPDSTSHFFDLSMMRVIRILRLVRIIRLARVMRRIGELRTMVMSIMSSLKSLLWAICLLFLLIYVMAVYLTSIVRDAEAVNLRNGLEVTTLNRYFGTLGRSILVLYQSVTGGMDWDDAVAPLMDDISDWLGFMYACYVAFVVLAMMNVVTGVFTETALLSAKRDQDIYMVNHVRDLFHQLDLDNTGMISWQQIEQQMGTPEMQEYFKAIDIDVSEAQGLFKLLDLNDCGIISSDDFLNGCIRIRGPARALETMLLLRETTRMSKKQLQISRQLDFQTAHLQLQTQLQLPTYSHRRQHSGNHNSYNSGGSNHNNNNNNNKPPSREQQQQRQQQQQKLPPPPEGTLPGQAISDQNDPSQQQQQQKQQQQQQEQQQQQKQQQEALKQMSQSSFFSALRREGTASRQGPRPPVINDIVPSSSRDTSRAQQLYQQQQQQMQQQQQQQQQLQPQIADNNNTNSANNSNNTNVIFVMSRPETAATASIVEEV